MTSKRKNQIARRNVLNKRYVCTYLAWNFFLFNVKVILLENRLLIAAMVSKRCAAWSSKK